MNRIGKWCEQVAVSFYKELWAIFHDTGAMIFFLLLPLAYPVVYTLVYNPELVRNLPTVVVDRDRSAQSRHLARMIDATETMQVTDYVSNMDEAKQRFYANEAMVILEIPEDYSKNIGRGEQANAFVYCQMPLLLRYRQVMEAVGNVQLALGEEISKANIELTGLNSLTGGSGSLMPVKWSAHQMGDPQQGFGSFAMPGIVVLILQQAMLLGICLMAGTRYERRQWRDRSPGATIIGRGLCYVLMMVIPAMWLLHFIPEIFSLPHFGSAGEWLLLVMPLLLATAMLGQMIGRMMHEREDCFMWIVVTSVIFLFISGLTWPEYAMPAFIRNVSYAIPATWGINGFIRINSNDATLWQNQTPFLFLWGLVVLYFIGAWAAARLQRRMLKP